MDQKIRTRNFQARNERIETGVLVKTHNGKCCQWKAKGQCTKGDACSFRHDESKSGKAAQSSSLAARPPTQNDGNISSKGKSPRVRSPFGKIFKDRGEITLKETVRIRHVIVGIFPFVRTTKQNRDANSAKSAPLCTERLAVSLIRSAGEIWWKRFCCHIEFEAIRLCVFQDVEPPKSKSILQKGTTFLGPKAQRASLKKYITPHEHSGKKWSIVKCDSSF